ncbi:tagaturonate epimerase family protein [Verrucomicrobiota bacterium]
MKFDELEMDPAKNPAVLDTATWNPTTVFEAVKKAGDQWLAVKRAVADRAELPVLDGVTVQTAGHVWQAETLVLLAGFRDGQQAFVTIGGSAPCEALGKPIGHVSVGDGCVVSVHPADAVTVARFCRTMAPVNAPRQLGRTPPLGVGVRMTTAVWPGIFDAMDRQHFAANSIQNSVRELNILDDLLAGEPAPKNYACGFGEIETGYTGSSFEGLWLSGVLAALRHDKPLQYGADADHIQVKRDDSGLARARRVLDAARYYTFYTIDVSDVLDYATLHGDSWTESRLVETIPDARERRDLMAWHTEPALVSDQTRMMDADAVGRFATKYAGAMTALSELLDHLQHLKEGQPFDLELSIDEHPPEVRAFDCLTSDDELLFVLREIKRRNLPVTHIAPNVGVEKGWDYRHPDGLDGLHRRIHTQHLLAEEFDCILDIHSADDLGQTTRDTLRQATGGRLHYKISPSVQLLFAEVLRDFHPDLYQRWWQDAEAYAKRSAEGGSTFAAECLAATTPADPLPSPTHPVFHHYSFAFVGRRDEKGRFLYRDEFYDLSQTFHQAYRERQSEQLCRLASEVLG